MWLSFDCTCSIQQRTFGNDEIVVSNGILKVHPDKPFISLLLLPSNVKDKSNRYCLVGTDGSRIDRIDHTHY